MKKLFFKLLVPICVVLLVAVLPMPGVLAKQAPPVQWEKVLEVGESSGFKSVQTTRDGGYILAGNTVNPDTHQTDAWLVKSDQSGNIAWQKTYEKEGKYKQARKALQTSDGGYILGGQYPSGIGLEGTWLMKTDASGNIQWEKTYGGDTAAHDICKTTDGGYALTGWVVGGDMSIPTYTYLGKTDASGNILWQKKYGADVSGDPLGHSVVQTADGGYIIAGYKYSIEKSTSKAFLIKTDASGNVSWEKNYGDDRTNRFYCVRQTTDGGYIAAGDIITPSFEMPGMLIKTDASGNASWQKSFEAAYELNDVLQTPDGGYIAAGNYSYDVQDPSEEEKHEAVCIKADASGNTTWRVTFSGTYRYHTYALAASSDGGYVLAGETGGQGWLAKLAPIGPPPSPPPTPSPTGQGFETWVLVQNPNDSEATVTLNYMTTTGPVPGPTEVLPPNSRKTFYAADSVPDNWDVSTKVTSDKPVIAERAMYGGNRTWGHDSIGVPAPAKACYLAEGCTKQ